MNLADRGIRRSQQHGDADPVLEQDGGAALPGAGSTKKYLEERLRREQQQAAQAQQIQLQILAMQAQQRGRRDAASTVNQGNQTPTGR